MKSARRNTMKLRTSNDNVSPLKIEMYDHHRGLYLKRFTENIDDGGWPLTSYYFFADELFTSPTFSANKYNSMSTKASGNNSLGNSSFGSRCRFSLSAFSSMEITPPAEEEVFVMDDIQVRIMSGTKSGRSSSSSYGSPSRHCHGG
ncbi:hypothetical protein TanjilG_00109 [Lupinus angustifolius]|uniref:Uncharacterized protein n=1 Tax=Lupinus angustifolius TaxID=3871 RepID=A0A394CZZ1_LUPAN|nr:hypothetical protein TanjilG_00109 [Lupinus angustifolius]